MEIVGHVAPSLEVVSSNHSSVAFYTVDAGSPSYKEGLNIHACYDVSYDADVYVDVYADVGVYVDVGGPSLEQELSSDHSNDVCYNEDGAEVLVAVLVVVVVLNDGRKVEHQVVVVVVVVVVDSPSYEVVVVAVGKNDEVVVDNVYNHRHIADRNHLQYTPS